MLITKPLVDDEIVTEEYLVKKAMVAPLKEKIENAIGLLKIHQEEALRLSPNGYYLAYSGGKDSDVILELARMANVKYLPVYSVVTIDPPELVRYIKKTHPQVLFNRPKMAMLTMLWKKGPSCGPPTRFTRWCCSEYKESGGDGLFKILGVRAAESPRRKKMWKQVVVNKNKGMIVCPIVYWSDKDIWNFHRLRNIPHCELYDEGFKRLGCIGCPMVYKWRTESFKRWPKYEQAWKRSIIKFWELWHNVPKRDGGNRYIKDFESGEELYNWWVSGKARGKTDDCQFNLLQI